VSFNEFSKMIFKYAEKIPEPIKDEQPPAQNPSSGAQSPSPQATGAAVSGLDAKSPNADAKTARGPKSPEDEAKQEKKEKHHKEKDKTMTAAAVQAKKQHLHELVLDLKIANSTITDLMDTALPRPVNEEQKNGDAPSPNTGTDLNQRIDYKGFCKILNLEASAKADELFKLIDTDNSSTLEMRQLLIALTSYYEIPKEDKAKFAFRLFDVDGNNRISLSELLKILKMSYLASTEKQVQRKAESIMRHSDIDKDGSIGFGEFVAIARKLPNLLFPSLKPAKG